MSAIIAAIIHYFKKDREQVIKNFKKINKDKED